MRQASFFIAAALAVTSTLANPVEFGHKNDHHHKFEHKATTSLEASSTSSAPTESSTAYDYDWNKHHHDHDHLRGQSSDNGDGSDSSSHHSDNSTTHTGHHGSSIGRKLEKWEEILATLTAGSPQQCSRDGDNSNDDNADDDDTDDSDDTGDDIAGDDDDDDDDSTSADDDSDETMTTLAKRVAATATKKKASTKKASAKKGYATLYKQAVVRHHNYHRANHSAHDIVWNVTLAEIAKKIGSSCNYEHNLNVRGGGYGQNIAAGSKPGDVSYAITDLFYNDEVKNFRGLYGKANPSMKNFENWGHFSQIVWKDTKSVGCYTYDCSKKGLKNAGSNIPPYFTVCNYYPPGNWGGEYGANIRKSLNRATIHGGYKTDCDVIKNPAV